MSTVVLAVGLAACGSRSEPPERDDGGGPPPARAVPVVVTRDDEGLRAGCRPRQMATIVGEFFDAFNRGDASATRFVAPELAPNGGWYSVSEGRGRRSRHFVTADGGDLGRYFAERHRQDERMRLLELRVNSTRGDFEFAVHRRARDLARLGIRSRRAGGKGAFDCDRRKIVVWSLAMPHGGDRLCPPPRSDRRSVVACARTALQ